MNKIFLALLGMALLWLNPTMAQDKPWSSARPDGHAPISIMGDHYHKKGGWMFSYRYMTMGMEGNLSSSNDISDDQIYQNYMVAPQKMQMDMHMLGLMYAPSNNLTLMLMGNYLSNTMDLRTKMGVDFTTKSDGFGDLSLSGLIKISNNYRQSLHGQVGLSIPTGDIDQRDDTPMMANAQLAYPMQLGSGTWDPFLGITYLGQADKLSWGTQSIYKFRIGENSANYTLGNRFDVKGWGAFKLSNDFSLSASLNFYDLQGIVGADADLNPMMMPLFNTANSGRNQLDIGLGTNFYIPSGALKNLRLAAEVKLPVAQTVTGIQMENKLMATFGVQYSMGHSH